MASGPHAAAARNLGASAALVVRAGLVSLAGS
jgi:hypothetical protein